jgi:parallel beta-helix repeat protein
MTTTYPNKIDGYAQIRVARDGIDEIVAGDHNDLRSAVVSIEHTLGINPQGPFGTVVARLNDAYSNIEAHVLGHPPRHQDDVIMSPTRTGVLPPAPPLEVLPYSLPLGSLASQITGILGFLNDSIMYAGSGAITFADGQDIGFSLVRDAITGIIEQLGTGNAGTTKISGAEIVGAVFGVPAGTLRSQLVFLLNLIDGFAGVGGAGLVGAAGFSTTTGDKYTFLSANVQGQMEEAGAFLDEGASFREKAFNAFVASGMGVTIDAGDALVASGFVAANGRMIRYNGGPVAVADGVTSYVYAEVVNGVVTIYNSPAIPTRPLNPIVLLHRILRAGALWTADVDLRRYGVFSNDKNYVSVGNTPAGGLDGYGCDFLSLRSAVEYAKTLDGGNNLIAPFKIILASDITIIEPVEMQILLDTDGIEIDGCGRKVTTTVDAALFNIEANNITVKDLVLESNLAISGTALCLAHIGNTTNVNNLIITNCKLLAFAATPCPFFLLLGNIGATTTISKSVISNNIALVESGGIEYVSANQYAQVLLDSVVVGNNIYQSTFVATIYAGIKASQHCTIGDNIISGGFDTGIFLAQATQCRITGNLIVGYSIATVYMNTGIAIWNGVAGQDNGCFISDNTIKGINLYGIDCMSGLGDGVFISVCDNLIDNYFSVGAPPAGMVGIRGRGHDTWIVGNKITAPGTFAIENCSYAIGNQIYGHAGVVATTAAIIMLTSEAGVVSGNTIINVSGIGIDVNFQTEIVISNNTMLGNANSTTGISNINDECVVISNIIKNYTIHAIYSVVGDEITISNNRIIDCDGYGIILSDCVGAIVSNNWMESILGFGTGGILGTSSYSIISNNHISNYGFGGACGITLEPGAKNDAIIVGNVIKSMHAASFGAFISSGGWIKISVVGNIIDACPATGFDFSDAAKVLCADNILSGDGTATNGIVGFGAGSIINSNIIETYCANITDTAIIAAFSTDDIVIANNHVSTNNGVGINCNSGSRHVVSNNILGGMATGNADHNGIKNIGRESIIVNNLITSPNYYGMNVTGDFCIIEGNSIKSAPAAGIYITANRCVLSNNYIYQSGSVGISLDSALYSLVANNYMYQTDNGINVANASDHTTVIGNYTYQTQDTYAFQVDNSDHCSIVGNRSFDDPGNAITVASASNVQINGNYIYSCGAIGIQTGANRSHVNGNYIYDPGDSGIYVGVAATDSTISNNYIYSSFSYGIYALDEAHRLLIHGNMIQYSGNHGIYLVQNNFCSISNNHIYETTGTGICLDGASSNSSINSNWIFSPSVCGIFLGGTSTDCLINGNWIRDALGAGIYVIIAATAPSICGNYVKRCGGVGLIQVYLVSVNNFLCVGNSITDPTDVSTVGIDMSSSDGGLCVGNRVVSGGGVLIPAIKYAVGGSLATNYVLEGNMARAGANPGGFAALPLAADNGYAV